MNDPNPLEYPPLTGPDQIRHRHTMFRWWLNLHNEYPQSIMPIGAASMILGISSQRMTDLINEQRFTLVHSPEYKGISKRFIPFIELTDAPFDMNRGRPGIYGPKNRPNHKKEEEKYAHSKSLADKHLKRGNPA